MSQAMRELERLDRRALAALRFVHGVDGTPVARALAFAAPGVRTLAKADGVYALLEAPGFDDYSASFSAPPDVAPVALSVAVRDPAGEFLARRVQLRLPRDPDPARANEAGSLFRPLAVALYPAPAARPEHDWARLYLSVQDSSGAPAAHALIRVERAADASLLGRAMCDARGEALAAVAGIPLTPWSDADGPLLGRELEVRVRAFHDPAGTLPPDPDELDARRATLAATATLVRIAAGRAQSLALRLP